jgi:hypothetical protein
MTPSLTCVSGIATLAELKILTRRCGRLASAVILRREVSSFMGTWMWTVVQLQRLAAAVMLLIARRRAVLPTRVGMKRLEMALRFIPVPLHNR